MLCPFRISALYVGRQDSKQTSAKLTITSAKDYLSGMLRAYHWDLDPLTSDWQLIPGHEVIGTVAAVGKNEKDLE